MTESQTNALLDEWHIRWWLKIPVGVVGLFSFWFIGLLLAHLIAEASTPTCASTFNWRSYVLLEVVYTILIVFFVIGWGCTMLVVNRNVRESVFLPIWKYFAILSIDLTALLIYMWLPLLVLPTFFYFFCSNQTVLMLMNDRFWSMLIAAIPIFTLPLYIRLIKHYFISKNPYKIEN